MGTFYYESKYVFEDGGAKGWARENNKNVLIQRGRKIWRVTPEGDIKELEDNKDFKIIESIKKKKLSFNNIRSITSYLYIVISSKVQFILAIS